MVKFFQTAAAESDIIFEDYTVEEFRAAYANKSTDDLSEYERDLADFIHEGEASLAELNALLGRLRGHIFELNTLRVEHRKLKGEPEQDCSQIDQADHELVQKYNDAQQFHKELKTNVDKAKNLRGFAQHMLDEKQGIIPHASAP
jgi:DNA repair exonuclease SbcCD ATPase subunit